jgi:hypothetical protein
MRVTDDRYSRDLQRHALALRMLALEARTQTVCQWTGLNPDRVRQLLKSYAKDQGMPAKSRQRGPSPHQVYRYIKTGPERSEAAALVSLCLALRVIPAQRMKNPRKELPTLQRGERLCKAFEMYIGIVPQPTITYELAVLLVTAVVESVDVWMTRCEDCRGVILVSPYSCEAERCTHCGTELASSQALSASA